MQNSINKLCLSVTLIFLFAVSVFAWDDAGHKLTAYIAWEQMSVQAREKAVKILLKAPEDSHLSVFYLQDSRSAAAKQRELFMIAATWSDIVRDKNFKNRYAKYHRGSWHYLDTFWREADGKIEIVSELKSDDENAVERLFVFDKMLRDDAVSDADKAIALAWILHIGGDIHQPLHSSARVTKYDPKGDQGGNRFMLSPKEAKGDERISLHWYWDSIVGRNVPRGNDACDSDYLPPIAQEIMKKYPLSKMRNRFEIGKFDQWQKEGFQIASTRLYPTSLKFGEMPTENYKKMAFEIAQEQIALAGYRLGETLNKIFAAQDSITSRNETGNSKIQKQAVLPESKIEQGVFDTWLWYKTRGALTVTNDLRNSCININVENSVITLTGTVSAGEYKERASQIIKGIEGVKAVKNMLEVMPGK